MSLNQLRQSFPHQIPYLYGPKRHYRLGVLPHRIHQPGARVNHHTAATGPQKRLTGTYIHVEVVRGAEIHVSFVEEESVEFLCATTHFLVGGWLKVA